MRFLINEIKMKSTKNIKPKVNLHTQPNMVLICTFTIMFTA